MFAHIDRYFRQLKQHSIKSYRQHNLKFLFTFKFEESDFSEEEQDILFFPAFKWNQATTWLLLLESKLETVRDKINKVLLFRFHRSSNQSNDALKIFPLKKNTSGAQEKDKLSNVFRPSFNFY